MTRPQPSLLNLKYCALPLTYLLTCPRMPEPRSSRKSMNLYASARVNAGYPPHLDASNPRAVYEIMGFRVFNNDNQVNLLTWTSLTPQRPVGDSAR